MWHCMEPVRRAFGLLLFPPFLHSLMVSANENTTRNNWISTLSKLMAELSFCTIHVANVAGDKVLMCCT